MVRYNTYRNDTTLFLVRYSSFVFVGECKKLEYFLLTNVAKGVVLVREMEKEMYSLGYITQSEKDDKGVQLQRVDGGVVRLEHRLLNLGALNQVCAGVFYFMPIFLEECTIVR
jgi:hypothetical protein